MSLSPSQQLSQLLTSDAELSIPSQLDFVNRPTFAGNEPLDVANINTLALFSQTGTGVVARSLEAKIKDYAITPQDFGAKGNGSPGQSTGTDDTAAIQAWLNELSPTVSGYIPAGVYNISSTVFKNAMYRISIQTAGAACVVFNYIGTNTNIDIIRFGDTTKATACAYWNVGGFTVESATKMTGGSAVRACNFIVYSKFDDVACGNMSTNGNLYHGLWLDMVNVFHLSLISATKCQGDGLRVNGVAGADSGSDLILGRGAISFCGNGLHQGGGFGGLRTGQLNNFANGINYLFDTTIVAQRNREIFYEPGSVCDGATTAGIVIDDSLTSNSPISLEGFIGSSGQLVSGAGPYHGVWIKNWPNGRIAINSAELFNCLGNGVQKDDQSVVLTISPTTHLFNNSGYGVACKAADVNNYFYGGYVSNNGLGNFDTNSQLAYETSYTSTLTPSSGSITTQNATMEWTKIGKQVTFTTYFSTSNIGSASGTLTATLPFVSRQAAIITGMDISQSGKTVHAFINSNSSTMSIANYDNSFPIVNNSVLVISGTLMVT